MRHIFPLFPPQPQQPHSHTQLAKDMVNDCDNKIKSMLPYLKTLFFVILSVAFVVVVGLCTASGNNKMPRNWAPTVHLFLHFCYIAAAAVAHIGGPA